MIKKSAVFLVAVMAMLTFPAASDVPQLIHYQAKLTDSGGTPLNGTFDITFRIYNVASGGTALWTEPRPGFSISSGNLNVLLGSVTTIPTTLFDEPTRYLGIQIDTDPEMSPRQQIVSNAYSFRAHSAQNWLPGGALYEFPSTDTPVAIPQMSSGSSSINVSGAPTSISTITVDVDINPCGEMNYVRLQSPSATTVDFAVNQIGGTVVGNFDKTLIPDSGDMSDFEGENPNGTWTLSIQTGSGLSTSTVINSWQININEPSCDSCSVIETDLVMCNNIEATGLTMATDAGNQSVSLQGDGKLNLGGATGATGGILVKTASGNNTLQALGSSVNIGGTGNACMMYLYGSGGSSTMIIYGGSGSIGMNGYIRMQEMTEPGSPPSNQLTLFAKDNGSGKTQLCVKFSDGSVSVLATQP